MAVLRVKPRFNLKGSGQQRQVLLSVSWSGIRLQWHTSISIDSKLWDCTTERLTVDRKKLHRYKSTDLNVWALIERTNSRLDSVHRAVTDFFIMWDSPDTPKREELKSHLVHLFKPNQVSTGTARTVLEYIAAFICECEDGERLTPSGTRYHNRTIAAYRAFRNKFAEYQDYSRKVYGFDDIDLDFYDGFTAYLTEENYKPNSIGKHIKNLKVMLRAGLDQKVHSNRDFQSRRFRAVKMDAPSVYLTQREVDAIASLDLSADKRLEITRDVFLIGVHTAQRFSDYSRIDKTHIKTTNKGTAIISMDQYKTKARVQIPIKPELSQLLEKYNFIVPHCVEQTFNKRIKVICEMAGVDEPTQVVQYRKGTQIYVTVPKYSLVSSHTARRTGCTLMHLAGIPALTICKISGHRSVKQLMTYIRVTEEQTADELSLHKYFTRMRAIK